MGRSKHTHLAEVFGTPHTAPITHTRKTPLLLYNGEAFFKDDGYATILWYTQRVIEQVLAFFCVIDFIEQVLSFFCAINSKARVVSAALR